MNFWLKFCLSALALFVTPTLAIFSDVYDKIARKIGVILPQHVWVSVSLSFFIALLVLIFYVRQYWIECHKNFKSFLRPVQGKGYCVDVRYDEPVCPGCAAKDAETFMRFIPSHSPQNADILFCNVCNCVVDLETCSAKQNGIGATATTSLWHPRHASASPANKPRAQD